MKKYWIIYEDNKQIIKELTWKQRNKSKVASNFNWDNKDSAERYLHYLNTRRIK